MKSKSDFPSLNAKPPEGLKKDGTPYRLLVVEDKDFHRKQLVQIFESEEYEITATAGNGKEAVDLFDKLDGKIDVVTTSLDLPVLDGYALTFELNQRPKKPLIIFISDDTTKGVMKDLVSMGIGDFILKPINRRIILERVKTAIERAGI